MKIFCFDEYDYVVSKDKETAIKWYKDTITDDIEFDEIKEISTEKEIWLEIDSSDLKELLRNGSTYEIKAGGYDGDFMINTQLKDIIELRKYKETDCDIFCTKNI